MRLWPRMSTTVTPAAFPLRPGAAAFDATRGMVCVIWSLDGDQAEVARPTGLHWRTHIHSLHPATPRQQRELTALTHLRRHRLRGLP